MVRREFVRSSQHPEFVVLVLLLFFCKGFASIVLIASEFVLAGKPK
jgi:hypothetical protein